MGAPQWIDVSRLPFETMLLLEDIHLKWFPRDWKDNQLGVALKANPSVHDFMRVRLGDDSAWVDAVVQRAEFVDKEYLRRCEVEVMKRICDWIVYVKCPEVYDRQPFLRWDDGELTALADFRGNAVADIGSGTGRLLEPLLEDASILFAVEPVKNLREYMKEKFRKHSDRFFAMDGLITGIPLPRDSVDIVVSGHVFGDEPHEEMAEMERISRPGGMVILCPGNSDLDNDAHDSLVSAGYSWSTFHEPQEGMKRKYWKSIS